MTEFDKEKLSELLSAAQGDRTREYYASDAGISLPQLSKFINRTSEAPPKPSTIRKLASVARNRVTYEMLMEACGYTDPRSSPIKLQVSPSNFPVSDNHGLIAGQAAAECVLLPVFKVVKMSPNGPEFKDPISVEYVCTSNMEDLNFHCWLEITRESMTGEGILPGDLALVRIQQRAENDSLVVVLIEGEIALKRFFMINNNSFLQSLNTSHPPIVDLNRIVIIGQVLEIRRKL